MRKMIRKSLMVMHAMEACFALERLERLLDDACVYRPMKRDPLQRAIGHLDLILGRKTKAARDIEEMNGRRDSSSVPSQGGENPEMKSKGPLRKVGRAIAEKARAGEAKPMTGCGRGSATPGDGKSRPHGTSRIRTRRNNRQRESGSEAAERKRDHDQEAAPARARRKRKKWPSWAAGTSAEWFK